MDRVTLFGPAMDQLYELGQTYQTTALLAHARLPQAGLTSKKKQVACLKKVLIYWILAKHVWPLQDYYPAEQTVLPPEIQQQPKQGLPLAAAART
jgi:hypothetical protein